MQQWRRAAECSRAVQGPSKAVFSKGNASCRSVQCSNAKAEYSRAVQRQSEAAHGAVMALRSPVESSKAKAEQSNVL